MYIVPLKRNIFTWIVRRSLRADVSKYRPESIGKSIFGWSHTATEIALFFTD